MDEGNPTRKDNGVERREVDTVILTYDSAADHLDVGGHCSSLDKMLDMLGRATRVIEAKQRLAQALELRQQMADAQHNAAIAASLRKV